MSKLSLHELFVKARNRLEGRWFRGWGSAHGSTCAVGSLICAAYGEGALVYHNTYMGHLCRDYPELYETLKKHNMNSLSDLIVFNDDHHIETPVLNLFDEFIAETAPAPEVPMLEVEQSDGSTECIESQAEKTEEKVLVTA